MIGSFEICATMKTFPHNTLDLENSTTFYINKWKLRILGSWHKMQEIPLPTANVSMLLNHTRAQRNDLFSTCARLACKDLRAALHEAWVRTFRFQGGLRG